MRDLTPLLNRMIAIGASFAVVSTVAFAQTGGLKPAAEAHLSVKVADADAPPRPVKPDIAEEDLNQLRLAVAAVRTGDVAGAKTLAEPIRAPVARKIFEWVLTESRGQELGFSDLDRARKDLADWPRAAKRQALAEQSLETGGLDATAIIGWFATDPPKTAQGAMALAAAYQSTGHPAEAQSLVRQTWRTLAFDSDAQKSLLARFGSMLSSDDHVARANLLLYGQQGSALKDLMPLLPADQRALAEARVGFRNDARQAPELFAAVPSVLQSDKGLVYERAGYLRRKKQEDAALQLAASLPSNLAAEDAASRVWTERRQLINVSLKRADYRAAYNLAANAGMTAPSDIADAEFFAGWLALSKLKDAQTADGHFARIQAAGNSPITQSRALFWRGRAHEAMGDKAGAQAYFTQAARYYWTFYGQLAAGQAGVAEIKLDADPSVTAADRTRFEAGELVKAARILSNLGEKDLLRAVVLLADDGVTQPADYVQWIDLALAAGDQDLAMRVARTALQKGVAMPRRGYPVRDIPEVASSAEPALVFAITRQESNFDPAARSSVGARGLMQVMPSTGQIMAQRMGVAFSPDLLDDGDYNMRIGATYLGNLVDRFGGSYVLAIAGYNAGPNRPDEWVGYCGDPRTPGFDPLDFVECIPFSETRNYVMRVLENMAVYRARLAKGETPPVLAADLKRGTIAQPTPSQLALP